MELKLIENNIPSNWLSSMEQGAKEKNHLDEMIVVLMISVLGLVFLSKKAQDSNHL